MTPQRLTKIEACFRAAMRHLHDASTWLEYAWMLTDDQSPREKAIDSLTTHLAELIDEARQAWAFDKCAH